MRFLNRHFTLHGEEGGDNPGTPGGGLLDNPGAAGGDNPGDNPGTPGGWNYAEGLEGTGDRPDWFKEKYTSVEAQAQAYNAMEERFRGFTGAPEEYKFAETKEGEQPNGQLKMLEAAISQVGKDANMNQETFDKMLETISTANTEYMENIKETNIEATIKGLANFDTRRTAIVDTAQTILTADQFDSLNDLMQSPESFAAIEALTAAARGGSLPGSTPPVAQESVGELMQQMEALPNGSSSERNAIMAKLNSKGLAGKII